MQTATSETESKSRDLSICVHHYRLRAPCPKGQGNNFSSAPAYGTSSKNDPTSVQVDKCMETFCKAERGQ